MFPHEVSSYQVAEEKVVNALADMGMAMFYMGKEHLRFHEEFNEAQERIQNMKKAYAPKELSAEVVRAKALEPYLSAKNLSIVTALGHYEVEKASAAFQKQEKELDEIRKKTAELLDTLLEDGKSKNGGGHDAEAESAEKVV